MANADSVRSAANPNTPARTGGASPAVHKKVAGMLDTIDKLRKGKGQAKEAAKNAGAVLVHGVEATVAGGAASLAEGYWGAEKMKLGGKVDWRWLGVVGIGWNVVDAFRGKPTGGAHAGAVGTGLVTIATGTLMREVGETMRAKRAAATAGGAPAAGPAMKGEEERPNASRNPQQGQRDIEGGYGVSPPPGGRPRRFTVVG